MKSNKRMNTNQTNTSNKKSLNIIHQNQSFQLPKIQKSSNYQTNSNRSYDFQFNQQKDQQYRLDQIIQNQKEQIGIVNYQKMTMEDIKLEYQRLRDQVNTLSSEIKQKQDLINSKVIKKHSKNSHPVQTEKKLAQTQQEVYQNSQLLFKLRQQSQQLDKRSNLANSSISRPNAELNDKILSLRQKILTIKQKIKLLKRKTKKTGQDMVNGEDIHEVLSKLERQQKAYEAKQANLEGKLDESKYKIQRQDQKLNQIQRAYSDAQDYLKLFKLQNEEIVEKNTLVQQWRQKIHRQQVIRKKIESDQQSCLQKYHQLLKLFEIQSQKQQKLDKRLIDEDIKILRARNSVLDFQRQLQSLQQIYQQFNEQQQLKKQAQVLRKAMQGGNQTFMTDNGISMAPSGINNHMIGVKSIIQENESDVRETIDGSNEQKAVHNQVRVKTKDRLLFTKVQEKKSSIPKKQNRTNSMTAKSITDEPVTFTDGKYYLSSKQINKKREQQKNMPTLKKQSSINQSRNGRKIYSLIKQNNISKLKELSMNKTASKQIKIPNMREDRKDLDTMPLTAKQPYLSLSKNSHQKQIQKGKAFIRQRKSSFKSVNKIQSQQKDDTKINLLQELQQINNKLLGNNSNQDLAQIRIEQKLESQSKLQVEQIQKTKPLYEKQKIHHVRVSQQITRAQLSGKILKPSSKEGRVAKPGSKEGQIRHQSNAIKPEVLDQIDKRNIEYSMKIQQMKKQLIDKKGDSDKNGQYKKSQNKKILPKQSYETKQQTKQKTEKQTKQQTEKQTKQQTRKQIKQLVKDKQEQKQVTKQQLNSLQVVIQGSQIANTKLKQNILSDSQIESQDDDIQADISQINRMIKKKLQNQAINAQ